MTYINSVGDCIGYGNMITMDDSILFLVYNYNILHFEDISQKQNSVLKVQMLSSIIFPNGFTYKAST